MMTNTQNNDLNTEITQMFGIKHPIFLAGMNVAAGAKLAAAVSNAGGLGVIGGLNYTPKMLRLMIKELKASLIDQNLPFGVDLLLPKVGVGARKTNHDYTKGHLDELIDVIIDEGAKLFVSAVGVPTVDIVNKLHSNGILVMNMVGAPNHVVKALDCGVDIICAQGGEGGGHTGNIGTMVLIPAVIDACRGRISPLTQKQVQVVASGGIYDGRTLASALCLGASAVWVGTRFVASVEASAPKAHKDAVLKTRHGETMKTLVFTGRPLRISDNQYAKDWMGPRRDKMEKLLSQGIIPAIHDMNQLQQGRVDPEDIKYLLKYQDLPKPHPHISGQDMGSIQDMVQERAYPHLMGQVAGSIHEIKTAKQIIDDMMQDAQNTLSRLHIKRIPESKL